MSWLIKFIQKGGTVKGAIREFFTMNGRMPRTSEMNKILQAFGAKGNFPKGWTPKVIEGGKSEPKIGLGEFPYQRSFKDEIDQMIKKGDITLGTAPKTTPKPAVDPRLQRWVDQQEWAAKKQAENKASLKRFEDKFGKPEDRASGGLAGQLHLNRPGYKNGLDVTDDTGEWEFLEPKKTTPEEREKLKKWIRDFLLEQNKLKKQKLSQLQPEEKPETVGPPYETNKPREAIKEYIRRTMGSGVTGVPIGRDFSIGFPYGPDRKFDFGIGYGKGNISGGYGVNVEGDDTMGIQYQGNNFGVDVEKKEGSEPRLTFGFKKKLKKKPKYLFSKAKGGIAGQLHLNEGGRVPAFKGGVMKLLKAMGENNPLQAYKKYLASVKRRSQAGDMKSLAPELGAITGGGILVNRAMSRKLKDITNQERDAWYKKLEAEYREEHKDDPDMLRLKLEMLEEDRENFQNRKWWQRGPAYNDGGRARFDNGGMSRRNFLKLMGGLASIPILGKFFKFAKPATKVMTAVEKSNAAGMPKWFPSLVNKVMKEGKDVTKQYSTVERSVVKQAELPNSKTKVLVEQDLTTGNTTVDVGLGKHGWVDGYHGQPVRLHLKKGEWIEPQVSKTGKVKKKAVKTKDEFDVEEAEFTGDAESVKYEESSFEKFGEHGSDFSEVEKYATGKVTKTKPSIKAERAHWEPDYAKGGRVSLSKGGLAKILGA